MRKFNYISKDFKDGLTGKYILSLQFSAYEYGYSVYSPEKKKFLVVKFDAFDNDNTICNKIETIFKKEKILSQNFLKSEFIFVSPKATLIPKKIYNPENKKDFLELNHYINAEEAVVSNEIQGTEIVNVFAIPNCIRAYLASKLTNYTIYNQFTSFIESSFEYSKAKKDNTTRLFINVDNFFFNASIMEADKLILSNSYDFKSIDDFVYYTHLIFGTLKKQPSDMQIVLSGNISSKVGTYKALKKYFPDVVFKDNFPKASFSNDLKLDKHYFDNLIYITV